MPFIDSTQYVVYVSNTFWPNSGSGQPEYHDSGIAIEVVVDEVLGDRRRCAANRSTG